MRAPTAIGLITLVATSARAQACNHALVGRVTDLDGKSYPGVTVAINGQQAHAVSDSTGHYRLCNPMAGAATVVTRALGATPALRQVMIADSGEQALDLQLARRGPCRAAPRLNAAELDAAERRWKEKGPHAYTFESSVVTAWQRGGPWLIAVRSDTVVSAVLVGSAPGAKPAPSLKAFTNDLPVHLFEQLRRRLNDSGYTTTVKYDSVLGFPSFIMQSPNCTFDAEWMIYIDSLRPIAP